MSLAGEIKAYARFARELRPFLREPVTYEQAASRVKERLATREETFLEVVEKNIFGNPKSPYLRLLNRPNARSTTSKHSFAITGSSRH